MTDARHHQREREWIPIRVVVLRGPCMIVGRPTTLPQVLATGGEDRGAQEDLGHGNWGGTFSNVGGHVHRKGWSMRSKQGESGLRSGGPGAESLYMSGYREYGWLPTIGTDGEQL